MKRGWIFGLVAGLVLLFFSTGIGINTVTEPTCDGKTMTAGMVCKTTNGGVVSEETYEQKRASLDENPGQFDKVGRWVFLGLGVALTALSGYKLIAGRRTRKPVADAPQQPGQFGPPGR